MKIFFLILIAGLIFWVERKWSLYVNRSVSFSGKCDRILAEPDQIVTWTDTVCVNGNLPIPYAQIIQRFPYPCNLEESPEWIRKYCVKITSHWRVDHSASLLPGASRDFSVRFSVPKRGRYSMGDSVLWAGDIMGFREQNIQRDVSNILVIAPRRYSRQPVLDAVGGFLGDMSVRRFIMEDPILTVGFREYTGHEPMKAISWKRTASSGALQVRQYDHTAEQHMVVLLNVEDGTDEQLEECFSIARTVCEALERRKLPYGFKTNGNLPLTTGKLFHLPEGLGEQHLNTILYGLGGADYTCFGSFRNLVNNTLRSRKIHESYIVITPPLSGSCKEAVDKLSQAVNGRICTLVGTGEVQQE